MDVSRDPWIPKEGMCRPIFTHPEIHNYTVAQLRTSNGSWNEALVNASFLESDAKAILNIPISPLVKDDEIIWDLDPRGVFSVKSAYRLGTQLQFAGAASTSNINYQEDLWKNFWKIRIPSKIKICGWRIYNDILPFLPFLI